MHIDLIHRFTATSTHCLDVQLREDRLGILSRGILPGSPPYTYLTSLALVNIPQKQCASILTYDSRGPGTEDIWSALLRYDSSQKHWVIGLLQGYEYIGLRTAMVGADQRLSLSPFCLLDFNEDKGSGVDPLPPLLFAGQCIHSPEAIRSPSAFVRNHSAGEQTRYPLFLGHGCHR